MFREWGLRIQGAALTVLFLVWPGPVIPSRRFAVRVFWASVSGGSFEALRAEAESCPEWLDSRKPR